MSIRFLANLLLCAMLAVLPVAAIAQNAQVTGSSRANASSGQITFRVCNKSTDNVMIGVSYIVVGGSNWRNKGWTPVNTGECQDIFVTTNKTWYARAEVKGDSSQYWGSDIKQCVEYPGPYDFNTASEDTSCPEGESADFTTFTSDGNPVYVWNLNP